MSPTDIVVDINGYLKRSTTSEELLKTAGRWCLGTWCSTLASRFTRNA